MTDYTYEVTDTGKYYYENNVRIFPEQFWQIIKKLEYENKELKKELALSKPLYSRRQLEKEKEQLESKNKILLEHCDDLQERNDRQADTIQELYNLIENKDWETLTAMIEELNNAEEQLMKEWRIYND